jgi:beta-lactamase regulating signal transducer with metallopeptidase domain
MVQLDLAIGLKSSLARDLLFVIVVLTSLSLRRGSARARYLLWLAASIKFAVPSALIIFAFAAAGIKPQSVLNSSPKSTKTLQYITPVVSPLVVPSSYLPQTASEQVTASSTNEPSQLSSKALGLAASFVWLLGAASLFWVWFRRRRQISLIIKSGRIILSGREYETLERVKGWLGITRRVDLIVTPQVTEPGVWRVWSPVVLLSEAISSQLSDEELETLMMHEMGHVLRWDNLVSNLNMILCCIFWFNPIIWLIDNWLLKEREEACDEMVLRWSGTGEVYASSIKKIYRFCLISRVSGLSAAGGSKLKHRLENIVANAHGKPFSIAHKLLVGIVISGSVLLTVIAAMQPGDLVVAKTNTVLIEAASGLKQQIVARISEDCPETDLKKCLPAGVGTVPASTLGEVVINSGAEAPLPADSATVAHINEPQLPQPPNVPAAKPAAELVASFQAAHAVNLDRFVGRYGVDPYVMENFVLDVTAEDGDLWLKPSHAKKRRLIAQSMVDYLDTDSSNTRISFSLDENGNVESLTLRGWGPTIVAPRLALPSPSREGNIVFKLSGYSEARIVAVAGTFNNWNQSQYLFERVGNEWMCRISLPPGKYQYKFIVDGNWLIDPSNPTVVQDQRGIENSQLVVR